MVTLVLSTSFTQPKVTGVSVNNQIGLWLLFCLYHAEQKGDCLALASLEDGLWGKALAKGPAEV